jgi:TP901 family phage tail tape measure protein
MRQTVQDLAVKTGSSTKDIANGYRQLSNEGFNAAQTVKVLSAANELAVATGSSVADNAKEIGAVMKDYGISVNNAARAENALYVAQQQGNLTQKDIADTAQRLIAINGALQGSLADVLGAVDALTRAGVPVSTAVTGVLNDIQHLIAPTSEATKVLKELDRTTGSTLVQDFSLAGLRARGFGGILDEVTKASNNNAATMDILFGKIRGGTTAIIDSTTANADYKTSVLAIQAALDGKVTPATAAFTREQDLATSAGDRLKASIGRLVVDLGQQLGPVASGAANAVASLANGLDAGAKNADAMGAAASRNIPLISGLADAVHALAVASHLPQGPPPAPTGEPSVPGLEGATVPGMIGGPPVASDIYGPPAPTAAQNAAEANYLAQKAYNKALADAKALVDSYAGQSLKKLQSQQQAITASLDQQRSAEAALRSQMDAAKTAGDDVTAAALNDQLTGLSSTMQDEQSKLEAVNSAMASVRSTTDLTAGSMSAYAQAAAAARSASDIYKEALQQQQDAVDAAKDAVSAYKTTVDDAKTAIQQLAQTSLKGTQAFSDQAEAVQEQINRVQLQIDRSTLAGGSAPAALDRQLKQLQDRKKVIEDTQAVQLGPEQFRIQRAAQVATQPAEMTGPSILAGIAKGQAVISLNFPKEQQAELTESIAEGLLKYGKQLLADATKAAQSAADAVRAGGTKAPVSITMSPGMIRIENLVTSAASQADIEKFLNEVGIQGVGAIADALATGQRVPVGTKAAA